MTKEDQREIQRKLRVLQHAERTGQVSKTCLYFGIGRASFYRWKRAYERNGEDALANAKPIPKLRLTRHRSRSRRRFSIFGASTTSGPNASCGTWRAIMQFACRTRPFTASSGAMG